MPARNPSAAVTAGWSRRSATSRQVDPAEGLAERAPSRRCSRGVFDNDLIVRRSIGGRAPPMGHAGGRPVMAQYTRSRNRCWCRCRGPDHSPSNTSRWTARPLAYDTAARPPLPLLS